MLKRYSLITLLIFATGIACICPAWALDVSRIKTSLVPPLEENDKSGEVALWSFYIETYDENGPLAKWESIPGLTALQLAAQDYAVLTDDYDVAEGCGGQRSVAV